jgi:hypothetical protein
LDVNLTTDTSLGNVAGSTGASTGSSSLDHSGGGSARSAGRRSSAQPSNELVIVSSGSHLFQTKQAQVDMSA